MSLNKTYNLLLFFMVFTCINAQLQLIVDFTSTTTYSNYQCGDSNVFPPCKSLSDAGERARQYVNSINTPSTNPSLEIKLRNDPSNPTIYGSENELGNLFGFCSIQVYVDTPAGAYITIDGSESSGPFILLDEPVSINPNIQCTSGVTFTIKYLNLNNWAENDVFYFGVDQTNSVSTNKVVTIQNVNVFNSSGVFTVLPKYSTVDYGSIKISFKACKFEELYSTTSVVSLPPFYLKGVIAAFNNCKINNSVLDSSELIYVDMGSLTITFGLQLSNVHVNLNYPIISTLNVGTKLAIKSGPLTLTNSSFSTAVYQKNTLQTTENPSYQLLENIKFNNCNILASTFAFNSLLYYDQSYTDTLNYKYTGFLDEWVGSVIPSGKVFLYTKNINLYTLTNDGTYIDLFDYPLISHYSNIEFFYCFFDTYTPLVGSNTILTLVASDINTTNLNLCQSCIVQLNTGTIIFDNTV